jgi:hypothetical protein
VKGMQKILSLRLLLNKNSKRKRTSVSLFLLPSKVAFLKMIEELIQNKEVDNYK